MTQYFAMKHMYQRSEKLKTIRNSYKWRHNDGNKKCNIPHLGTHWFNENAITNIISLADISDKFRVTMDMQKEKVLIVHMDNKK